MVSEAKQRESLSRTSPSDSFEETLRDQLPLRERPSEWEEEEKVIGPAWGWGWGSAGSGAEVGCQLRPPRDVSLERVPRLGSAPRTVASPPTPILEFQSLPCV